jgi:hypothetical protein
MHPRDMNASGSFPSALLRVRMTDPGIPMVLSDRWIPLRVMLSEAKYPREICAKVAAGGFLRKSLRSFAV